MTGRTDTRTGTGSPTTPDRIGPGPGAGTGFPRTSFLELAPLPGAIPCARLHTVNVLHEWGLRAQTDDAALIVSELMTNAAEASARLPDRPPVILRLMASEKLLVIEVWDHSPGDIQPREADPDAECGRGLTVVAALSDRWGCERTGYRRKVVWADVVVGPTTTKERVTRKGTTSPPRTGPDT